MGAIILKDTLEAQENVAKAVLTRLDSIPNRVYMECVSEYYKEKNPGVDGSADDCIKFQTKMLGWDAFGERSKFELEHFESVLERKGLDEQPLKQLEEERSSIFIKAILERGAQANFESFEKNDEDFFKSIIPVLEATADERNAIVDNVESQIVDIARLEQN